ncbi:hypothetical protein XELAEV_18004202mg [Xenopus laevis]|uniref:Uncharacterized protein n=1 Tax=Xenopus laevis TaxID=8355 RepID=A0A974BMT1_XENLA|nr:hypothetical protein XELAEV_18004202mg [Xenopus laevis]
MISIFFGPAPSFMNFKTKIKIFIPWPIPPAFHVIVPRSRVKKCHSMDSNSIEISFISHFPAEFRLALKR